MSSLSIANLQLAADNLNFIAMIFIRCYCYIVIPLGTAGHLMSIYVFTRPTLRSNPCSMYFLAATIVGLVNTCYTLPMRMIQSAFADTDPGAHSSLFCKIIWFTLYSIRGLCPWLIVLACCDRYLSSSTSIGKRAWSSIYVAKRIIPLTIFIGFLVYIHVPIYFDIDTIPAIQKSTCSPSGPPGMYSIILSFLNLIYFGLSPSLCMLLFGILTLRNTQRSKRLVARSSTTPEDKTNRNHWKINRHILRMLFLQVLVYSGTGLAFSIAMILIAINANQPKNVFQLAQDNMTIAAIGMFSNNGPCLSFYLFTLSSTLFRKELKKLFCRHTRVTYIKY
ncbi:unnamed protein product [Adineta steineri]|uniref:G-protein coupled receptors family 1 profile domain-containing protein n=1 Tax=Adineta steineri TaxID=433720 RepID=A0A819EK30_9BILA|nr:unnamed protein product [Adineta steineri]